LSAALSAAARLEGGFERILVVTLPNAGEGPLLRGADDSLAVAVGPTESDRVCTLTYMGGDHEEESKEKKKKNAVKKGKV
jgi:hypothetical protein